MTLFYTGFLTHFLLFLIACIFLFKRPTTIRFKRRLQILFALFVPFVGPAMTIAVYLADLSQATIPLERYVGQAIDESPYASYAAYHLFP